MESSSIRLEKINRAIKVENYEGVPEDLLKTREQISRDVALGRLPVELLEPPFSLNNNLSMIGANLSEAIASGNPNTLLNKSEIKPFLEGVKNVLETLKNNEKISALANSQQRSNAKYCVTFISRLPLAISYSSVMQVEGLSERDFWFRWEDDVEPVKIIYEPKKTMTLYRVHWGHHFREPYLDEQKRIQVFFTPYFHTPIVRTYSGSLFAVCMEAFRAEVNDYEPMLGVADWFRSYYASRGWKREHPPEKYYKGWRHADQKKV